MQAYLYLLLLATLCLCASSDSSAPSIKVRNGTIVGRHLQGQWNQDLFLGIPYAQPPVGSLRFRRPKELNASYTKPLIASKYGFTCYQHPNVLTDPNLTQAEDCLTLNVVRPHLDRNTTKPLPVLVWIYGGGFFSGSSADPQYNLSGITRAAQDFHQPIITISLNYRVGVMGFFQTPEVFANGDSNAGLLDQRLALRWIKENIAAFGGDPARVSVWGESSGAQSIALHLHSFGGRDDSLFQAAIMESGGFVGTPLMPPPYYVSQVDSLVRGVGCANASDQRDCLQQVPAHAIYATPASSFYWNPTVDGDFLTDFPSTLAVNGSSIKLPLLIGANSDEGITFGPATGMNNSVDVFDALVNDLGFAGMPGLPYQISPASAKQLLALYPNNPSKEPPYDIQNDTLFPNNGLEWRRSCAIYGDLVMVGSRRQLCEEYSRSNQSVFSYRFATRPWNAKESDGVGHFVNVVFSFQNVSGALGPLPQFQSYKDLSTSIGRAYVNFVHSHDPNGQTNVNGSTLPKWPRWTAENPTNMVLNATASAPESDTFRADGIRFINSISRELLG